MRRSLAQSKLYIRSSRRTTLFFDAHDKLACETITRYLSQPPVNLSSTIQVSNSIALAVEFPSIASIAFVLSEFIVRQPHLRPVDRQESNHGIQILVGFATATSEATLPDSINTSLHRRQGDHSYVPLRNTANLDVAASRSPYPFLSISAHPKTQYRLQPERTWKCVVATFAFSS
jgi:hypothetical protein